MHVEYVWKELLMSLKDISQKWLEASLGVRTPTFLFLPPALNLLSRQYFMKALTSLETRYILLFVIYSFLKKAKEHLPLEMILKQA